MKRAAAMATLCAMVCVGAGQVAQGAMAEHVTRTRVVGIDVLVYRTSIHDVVTLVGAFPAGNALASGNIAIPSLTEMMLDRGTTEHTKEQIATQLDAMGASIGFGIGGQLVSIEVKCLKSDLPRVMALLAEELRTPAFTPEEFKRAQQQFIGALQQGAEDADGRAGEAYARAVFPAGHPNRPHELTEYLAAAPAATLDEVKRFHQQFYGPAHLVLVLVGDVRPADARNAVQRAFAGWSGGHATLPPPAIASLAAPAVKKIQLEGKTSVSVVLGGPTGLRNTDRDSIALKVGTHVLGSGFTGRLMSSVRDKEGLTYGVGAGVGGDELTDGSFQVNASFAPQLLDKGLASTRRELQRWHDGGITADELAQQKLSLAGSYKVGLATTGGIANTLLHAVLVGRPVSWIDDYPQALQSLTLEQVNAAIRTHVDPGKLVLVEAGTLP